MRRRDLRRPVWATVPILAVLAFGTACTPGSEEGTEADRVADAGVVGDVEPAEPSQAVEAEVDAETEEKLAERRRAMLEEAHAALDETRSALRALEEDDEREALDALARATGKLELLLVRAPELALAPVDVDFVTHDVFATVNAIESAREKAQELLHDGRVQDARALVSGLASEFVIRVSNLPLATFPDAIKAVSPLIDEGRMQEAREAIGAALATLVVTEHVIALPLSRASHMLAEAQALADRDDRSEEDEKRLAELVEGARYQLEMAQVLGYGDDEEHEGLSVQIAELRSRLGDEEETEGTFARLRRSVNALQTSLFE